MAGEIRPDRAVTFMIRDQSFDPVASLPIVKPCCITAFFSTESCLSPTQFIDG
jgi:hypothetical protein